MTRVEARASNGEQRRAAGGPALAAAAAESVRVRPSGASATPHSLGPHRLAQAPCEPPACAAPPAAVLNCGDQAAIDKR